MRDDQVFLHVPLATAQRCGSLQVVVWGGGLVVREWFPIYTLQEKQMVRIPKHQSKPPIQGKLVYGDFQAKTGYPKRTSPGTYMNGTPIISTPPQ